MISSYDKARLNDIFIEDVAQALGLEVIRHKARCPFHEDSHPSLSFHVRTNRYRCFVCGASGGAIDLVMKIRGWRFRESCKWLATTFGINIDIGYSGRIQVMKTVRQYQPVKRDTEEQGPDIDFLSRLMAQPVINAQAARFLYEERRIQPEVVGQLGLSSILTGCPMSSRKGGGYFDGPALLIPYRDMEGRLMSVQSRYLGNGEHPRFRFPKGSRCHVFNTSCLKGLDMNEPVFITEGVTDCLALLSAGLHAIAIPSATLLKHEDVECFRERNLHMYPDADEPGRKLFSELKAICPQLVRHDLPSGFKDVGGYYAFIHRDNRFV